MKKEYDILIPAYAPWPVSRYELELLNNQASPKKALMIITCDGKLNFCPIRDVTKNVSCSDCIKMRNNLTKIIQKITNYNKVKEYKIPNVIEDKNKQNSISLNYNDRKIFSESTVMTTFKSLTASKDYPEYYNCIVKDYNKGLEIAKYFINNYNVKNFYIFNARMSFYRSFLYMAQKCSINSLVYEVPMIGKKNYIVTQNYSITDRKKWSYDLSFFLKELYKNISDKEKYKLRSYAIDWFENRINLKSDNKNTGAFDNKPYLKKNFAGLLPNICFIKNDLKLVTYYVSSDFELIGIPELDEAFEVDQFSLVLALAQWAREGLFRLVIRLHPNMLNSPNSELKKYQNLTGLNDLVYTVMPNDKIDSYSLAKISNVVVSYGSTIGLEASYLGTNSVVCGASHYHSFGVAKHVSNLKELSDILKSSKNQLIFNSDIKIKCVDMIVALQNFSRTVSITYTIKNLVFYWKGRNFGFIYPTSILWKKILRRIFRYAK